jgi:hypothetical protein
MKACHCVSTALVQNVAEIGTQSTMMTLHEFLPHIPPKTPKGNTSSSTNEMMHTDVIVRAQRARVSCTHARKGTSCHQNCQAINQLSRHGRQPALILHSDGIVTMDRLKRRRAKQSKSAEVRIKLAMLSSQCKTARKWETSTYTRNIGVRASTCNRHIRNKMTVWSHEV